MQKTKTVCKILMSFVIICTLTGCWDHGELEDKSYVIGLGIDKSKYNGKIKVTLLLANPEVGSLQGGGGSTEKPREIISFDANDFIAAKGTANAIISRSISYELLSIIVVSEEYAKESNFVTTIYDVVKDPEIRLNSYLAVSKENANEYFLKNKPRMETRPHKYFQFMVSHGIENGLIPDSTLLRFFKTLERGTDLFLAMYTSAVREKNPKVKWEDEYTAGQVNATGELDDTQFIGSAVFKDGLMIDTLTGQETRTVNILDDTTNISDILMNIPDPFSDKERQIAARVMKNKNNKIKMELKSGKPKIYITIPLILEIMSNPSMVNLNEEKNQKILESQITEHIKKTNEKLFIKSQKELKGAPYPLAYYARKYFGTIQEFNKFNWTKAYLDADVMVNPEIKIIDYGKQVKKTNKVGD
jgi:spore germination protein KC